MKKSLVALITVFFLIVSNYAQASLITYDITGGVDTEGNSFSGYVDINSVPVISYPTNSEGGYIEYLITAFKFTSIDGVCSGNSGYFKWGITPLDFEVFGENVSDEVDVEDGMAVFNNNYIVNYVGLQNSAIWGNASMGVTFTQSWGPFDSLATYMSLSSQIMIDTEEMFENMPGYWGPAEAHPGLILSECPMPPVPEPSTLLLLGSGLLSFAGFRKRFKR